MESEGDTSCTVVTPHVELQATPPPIHVLPAISFFPDKMQSPVSSDSDDVRIITLADITPELLDIATGPLPMPIVGVDEHGDPILQSDGISSVWGDSSSSSHGALQAWCTDMPMFIGCTSDSSDGRVSNASFVVPCFEGAFVQAPSNASLYDQIHEGALQINVPQKSYEYAGSDMVSESNTLAFTVPLPCPSTVSPPSPKTQYDVPTIDAPQRSALFRRRSSSNLIDDL
jgi:hypothetical protein